MKPTPPRTSIASVMSYTAFSLVKDGMLTIPDDIGASLPVATEIIEREKSFPEERMNSKSSGI